MTTPGLLNRRLLLEAPADIADDAGGVTRTYAPVATVWASLVPLTVRGDVIADSLAATVTHRIVIRAGREVTTQHRFRDGARVFAVVAVRDQDGRGRFLEIRAEERTA